MDLDFVRPLAASGAAGEGPPGWPPARGVRGICSLNKYRSRRVPVLQIGTGLRRFGATSVCSPEVIMGGGFSTGGHVASTRRSAAPGGSDGSGPPGFSPGKSGCRLFGRRSRVARYRSATIGYLAARLATGRSNGPARAAPLLFRSAFAFQGIPIFAPGFGTCASRAVCD